jgi:tetratricopeptide (TPR) repeat protein
LDESCGYVYLKRASSYRKLGQSDEAIADYLEIIKNEPKSFKAYWGIINSIVLVLSKKIVKKTN